MTVLEAESTAGGQPPDSRGAGRLARLRRCDAR